MGGWESGGAVTMPPPPPFCAVASFVGEMDGELSVEPGDRVKVGGGGGRAPGFKGEGQGRGRRLKRRRQRAGCWRWRWPRGGALAAPPPPQVHSEVGGWLRVIRLSDSRSGLVPSWAVAAD